MKFRALNEQEFDTEWYVTQQCPNKDEIWLRLATSKEVETGAEVFDLPEEQYADGNWTLTQHLPSWYALGRLSGMYPPLREGVNWQWICKDSS